MTIQRAYQGSEITVRGLGFFRKSPKSLDLLLGVSDVLQLLIRKLRDTHLSSSGLADQVVQGIREDVSSEPAFRKSGVKGTGFLDYLVQSFNRTLSSFAKGVSKRINGDACFIDSIFDLPPTRHQRTFQKGVSRFGGTIDDTAEEFGECAKSNFCFFVVACDQLPSLGPARLSTLFKSIQKLSPSFYILGCRGGFLTNLCGLVGIVLQSFSQDFRGHPLLLKTVVEQMSRVDDSPLRQSLIHAISSLC